LTKKINLSFKNWMLKYLFRGTPKWCIGMFPLAILHFHNSNKMTNVLLRKKNLLGFFHDFIFLMKFEFYTIVSSQNEKSEFQVFHILTFIMKSKIYIIVSSKDPKRKKALHLKFSQIAFCRLEWQAIPSHLSWQTWAHNCQYLYDPFLKK